MMSSSLTGFTEPMGSKVFIVHSYIEFNSLEIVCLKQIYQRKNSFLLEVSHTGQVKFLWIIATQLKLHGKARKHFQPFPQG